MTSANVYVVARYPDCVICRVFGVECFVTPAVFDTLFRPAEVTVSR